MTPGTSRERADQSLASPFECYLQEKGKGRGGDGGNYRRNAARELERFADWAAGDRGGDTWIGIVPDHADRDPTFEDFDERVFRSTPGISPATARERDSKEIPEVPIGGTRNTPRLQVSRMSVALSQSRSDFCTILLQTNDKCNPDHPPPSVKVQSGFAL